MNPQPSIPEDLFFNPDTNTGFILRDPEPMYHGNHDGVDVWLFMSRWKPTWCVYFRRGGNHDGWRLDAVERKWMIEAKLPESAVNYIMNLKTLMS